MAVHKKIRTKIHKKHIGIFFFIAIFAGIGTYLLINSRAATSTCVSSTSAIQSAVTSASSGGSVCVAPGSYGKLSLSGSHSAEVIVQPDPTLDPKTTGKVTFSGIGISGTFITVKNFYSTSTISFNTGSSNSKAYGNDVTASPGDYGIYVNCSSSGCSNIIISHNKIHDITSTEGVSSGGSCTTYGGDGDALRIDSKWNNITFEYNEVTKITQVPVTGVCVGHNDCFQEYNSLSSHDLTFDHNYFHDAQCEGFLIKDNSVANVNFTNNLYLNVSGISQIWNTTPLTVRNNTYWNTDLLLRADSSGLVASVDHNVFQNGYSNGCSTCSDGKLPYTVTASNNVSGGTTSQFMDVSTNDYRLKTNPNGVGIDWAPANITYGPASTVQNPTGPTANLWIDSASGTHSCVRVTTQETYASASDPANHRVCSSLSAALAAAAGGDTVRLLAGNYSGFTPAVTKSPVVKFIGAGVDATNVGTIDTQSGSGGLWFEGMTLAGYYNHNGTDGVTYKNIKINSNFFIRSTKNITWDHVEALIPGTGTTTQNSNFITSDYSGGPGSKNITIRDSYIHHFRRPLTPDCSGGTEMCHVDCIAADDVDGLLIERTKFEDCEAFAIIFGRDNGTGAAAKNVVLQNNVFNQHSNGASGLYDLCFTDQDGPTIVRHNSFIDDHGISECELLSAPGSVTIDSNAWNHSGAICGSSTFIFKNNVGGDNVCSGGKLASPKFVSASDGHLQSGSPAIDYGSGSAYSNLSPPLTALTTDYDNANRTNPPDAGAYEYQSGTTPTPKPGDTNNDNVVNIIDLSTLLSKWNTNTSAADFNKDNTVNIFDLSILLSNYGK